MHDDDSAPPTATDSAAGGPDLPFSAETAPPGDRGSRTPGRRTRVARWAGRNKALNILVVTALALVLGSCGWLVYLNAQLGDINRFDLDLDRPDRPTRVPGTAVNILLLGVDDPDHQDDVGPQLDALLDSGAWQPGAFRSDTMLVLHLNASREQAQLVSIPRDSWVSIPGHGDNKINAALSLGGPALAARTVEDTFGIFLDHVIMIDFQGLRDVTDTLGGVDVRVPETVVDTMNGKTWTQGIHHLDGDDALRYVRQRYGLPGGDFDRIQRQQNFLRAVLDKTVQRGTLLNPLKLSRLAGSLSGLVAVDSSMTNGALRDLVLSARGLRSHSIRFLTVPNDGSARVGAASVVKLRMAEARGMFDHIADDHFEGWYADHRVDLLPTRGAVN